MSKIDYVDYSNTSCGIPGSKLGISGARFSLSPMSDDFIEIILGSLDKTAVTKTKLLGINKAKEIDEDYKSHNVKFTKEEDRLVLSGRFKVKTNVKVILYRNLISKIYDFRVNKKPYTALCIDVFTEDENENGLVISRYINNNGLYGKYSIYLDIDGTLYNTGESVEF